MTESCIVAVRCAEFDGTIAVEKLGYAVRKTITSQYSDAQVMAGHKVLAG